MTLAYRTPFKGLIGKFRRTANRFSWCLWMGTNRIETEKVQPSKLEEIRHIKGVEKIQDQYSDYLCDEARYGEGKAEHLFYAGSEADVVSVVEWAQETETPLTISGGRTGLTGGAVPPGGALLILEQLTNLLGLGYDDKAKKWFLRAQAGITLQELNSAVMKKDLRCLEGKGTLEEQETLHRFLSDSQAYFFPPDPTEMTAHLGGSIAANASGARSFHYKATRNWIRRIRVVIPNGEVLDITRGEVIAQAGKFVIKLTNGTEITIHIPDYQMPKTKNAAGLFAKPDMDLIDLFIGSEGILGIITEAEVFLHEYPERTLTVFAFFPTEKEAIQFVQAIRTDTSPIRPTLVEYFDKHAVQMLRDARARKASSVKVPSQIESCQAIIFFEVPFVEAEMESVFMAINDLLAQHGIDMEGTWAGIERQDLEHMKAVRHLVPETVNSLIAQRKQEYPSVHKLGTDMAVPDQYLETILHFYKTLLNEAGMEYIMFGHIGENHIHVNILPRNDEEVLQGMHIYTRFAQKAVELGGTVSAEHGIGKLKRPFLKIMYGDKGLAQMAAIKAALDPKWIINPGNMVPRPGETIELPKAV